MSDMKIDTAAFAEKLKMQRNAYADECALGAAVIDALSKDNAGLKLEVEILSKALEALKKPALQAVKGEKHGAAIDL